MYYEVEPTPVSQRRTWPLVLAAIALAGMVAAAMASVDRPEDKSPATIAPVTQSRPVPIPTAVDAGPGIPPASIAAHLVDCHGVPAADCRRIALSAVGVLADPGAELAAVGIWRSLLCRDDLDCPPGRLAGVRPLGSALVRLADRPVTAWVNVIERPVSPDDWRVDPIREAWIIRWSDQ